MEIATKKVEVFVTREILRIVIGNICITSAYAFITVPRHVVNGGVTSFSMILHAFLPVDISVITNCVTVVLLGICLYFLGKAFLMKSLLSSICYMVMFSSFHAIGYSLSIPVLPAIILAAILVGIGYYLCISAGSSTVGFDVLALVLHKRYETGCCHNDALYQYWCYLIRLCFLWRHFDIDRYWFYHLTDTGIKTTLTKE